jgi:hypothetical protein
MEGDVLSGKQFNRISKGKKFVKLTNSKEIHNGFKYKTGYNVDIISFNPTGECRPGGIYFCEMDDMIYWLNYNNMEMVHCRDVTVPNDAKVYIEKGKYKADMLILGESKYICDIVSQIYMKVVKKDGLALEYAKEQTEDICLAAVQQNGLALEYAWVQTEEICLAAIQQNGLALGYVWDQTEMICKAAAKQNGLALEHLEK